MANMSIDARGAACAREGADYKGRANSIKRAPTFDMTSSAPHALCRRRRADVADLGRRADRAHGAGRRRHAADGIRAVDRRMEADHRHVPPLNEAEWTQEFESYKQIPQYRELNRA